MDNPIDTLALRDKLTQRHAKLADRLARVSRDGRHAGGLEADFEEQAQELQNDEVLANLDVTIRDELLQIEKTLERLDKGRYGICEICKNPISTKRLEALPYATRCVACENKPGGQSA